jgi:pectate lyase
MGIGHIVEKSIQMHVEMNLFDRIKLREKMLESQNRVVGYIIDELKEYMNSCIEWCENGNHNKVLMYFG